MEKAKGASELLAILENNSKLTPEALGLMLDRDAARCAV